MHTALIAALMVALFAAGVWLGVSGLTDQYTVDTSGSQASDATACTPSKAVIVVGEPVTFMVNIADVSVFWSTTEGAMRWVTPGRPQFTFTTPGTKTAWAMVGPTPEGSYNRVPCPVTVR